MSLRHINGCVKYVIGYPGIQNRGPNEKLKCGNCQLESVFLKPQHYYITERVNEDKMRHPETNLWAC